MTYLKKLNEIYINELKKKKWVDYIWSKYKKWQLCNWLNTKYRNN